MKTLEEQCGEYLKACYPRGAAPVQTGEVKQAFYAGALSILTQMQALPDDNEAQCESTVVGWLNEAIALCKARTAELKGLHAQAAKRAARN